MKKTLISILTMAALAVSAQSTFIKGTMSIKFDTKMHPGTGAKDTYTMNLNVCNSVLFHGTVTAQPPILNVENGWFSSTSKMVQKANLDFDLTCDVVNPNNPSQTKKIGRLYGIVPIDTNGVYHYTDGTLECSTTASKSIGTVVGKPPKVSSNQKAESLVDKIPMIFSKRVNGKTVRVQVKKYDKLTFKGLTLPSGPVQIYPETTVTGEMVYDYDRYVWYFNNLELKYATNGIEKIDRLTGDIRWAEDDNRKANGLGHYDFDVRVNEPPASEMNSFAAPSDESSFFAAADTSLSALTGTMQYKDTMNADGDTLASDVTVELTGNKLDKLQTMALCKLVLFAAISPMNSD